MGEIKSVKLSNFKQFNQFTFACRSKNILTGPNNAGKSSVLDALRILGDVLRYSVRQRPGKASLDGVGVCGYYQMPQNTISIPIENIATNYSDNPARVEIKFSSGATIYVHLHPEKSIDVYLDASGRPPTTGVQFRKLIDVDLCIVPTLGPFEETEGYLTDQTVEANRNTRRSSRNFRNIVIRMNDEEFRAFQELVETSWPGIKILKPIRDSQAITLMYEEDRIPREVFWSGFGLQVWLQMLLQIMRAGAESIFVMDEPDIYLHADLQRRLLHICSNRFRQLFLATHSTEIINEASPGDILMIGRNSRSAKRVSDEESYRKLFQYLGSSENSEFARMARAKRIVFFEGNDRKLLRKFARKLSVGDCVEDTDTVFAKIGGFGQWQRVVNASWTLSELFGMEVKMAALFDRDFRSDAEVSEFMNSKDFDTVCVRVLGRKEIENYALSSSSLMRIIIREAGKKDIELAPDEVTQLLFDLSDRFKTDTLANRSGQRVTFARKSGSKESDVTLNRCEILEFNEAWTDLDGRFRILAGKAFIGELSKFLQESYGFSVSSHRLIEEMHIVEVDPEIAEILESFDKALS